MFNPRIYENSRPDGIAVLEVVHQTEDDKGSRGKPIPPHFVPLQVSEVRGTVMGPLADLALIQTFGFAHATYDRPIEARYRFPLPGDAAVRGVTVRFGQVEIVAELQAREAAEAHYAEAKAEGQQAALATRESPDVFTLQIAGIQPDEPVTVTTQYVQLARADPRALNAGGEPIPRWSLRIPLTTAPRFVREDEEAGRWAQGQPLRLLRDPGHRFRLALTFRGISAVTSPTHTLVTTVLTPADETPELQVQLADGDTLPDRDCLLRWSPPQATIAPTLQLLTHRTAATATQPAQLYFLALVTPPTTPPAQENLREAILLVDHSGSMRGAKWAAADWAVERFLSDLHAEDTFALAIFHNETRWFQQAVQSATPAAVADATTWLKAQQDSGGTQLGVALEQALQRNRTQPATPTTLTRYLLIVTDAAVSDAARILRLADAEAQRPDRRRISVLCIDAAPNAFLAHELAARGGGVARFLTSDPAQDDIVTALDELLLAWSDPLFVDMQLRVNRCEVLAGGRVASSTQAQRTEGTSDETIIDLGDLAAGQTQWVVGQIPLVDTTKEGDGDDTPLTFTLSAAADAARQSLATAIVAQNAINTESAGPTTNPAAEDAVTESNATADGLMALFGAQRINALEYLMHTNFDQAQLVEQLRRLGYDPAVLGLTIDDTRPIYAENAQRESAVALRRLLVEEALTYGLASAETAFVATRTEAGEPVGHSVIIANALPAGWSPDFAAGAPPYPGQQSLRSIAPTMDSALSPPQLQSHGFSDKMRQIIAPSLMPAPAASTGVQRGASSRGFTEEADRQYTVFKGVPDFSEQTAVLYDSTEQSDAAGTTERSIAQKNEIPPAATISGIVLSGSDGNTPTLDHSHVGSVTLAIYLDDPITPRASIRLADLLRHGKRPLNLHRSDNALLRITLHDPTGNLQRMDAAFSLALIIG